MQTKLHASFPTTATVSAVKKARGEGRPGWIGMVKDGSAVIWTVERNTKAQAEQAAAARHVRFIA
jgi:hypothetical protein